MNGKQKKELSETGVKFGCWVDLNPGEKPDGCVKDYGEDRDCIHAPHHRSKWTCPNWKQCN